MREVIFILLEATVFFYIVYFLSFGKNKISKSIRFILIFIFVFLSFLYFFSFKYTGGGLNEASYFHLVYGNVGADNTSENYILWFKLIVSILVGLFLAYFFIIKYKSRKFSFVKEFVSLHLLFLLVFIHPFALDIYSVAFHYGTKKISEEYLFTDYYKLPEDNIKNKDKKNILFLYLESFERSYFDEEVFPGLTPNLKKLEKGAVSFTDVNKSYATSWTIAGMVASQCGIPLFTPLGGNSMSGMDYFLSGAKCIGDFLKKDGYYLSFLQGSSVEFAGKGKFYTTHGFDEVIGLEYYETLLEDKNYKHTWGLFDDTLYSHLYDKYISLSKSSEPFALFGLTIGDHFPDGHPSASCDGMIYGDGEIPILNSIKCSDYLLGEFIEKIKSTPYYDDTIIVITSDHLSMPNSAQSLLDKVDRNQLFMVLNSGLDPTLIDKPSSSMDKAPTFLDIIGYDVSEFGFGKSLLRDEKTFVEVFLTPRDALLTWKENISEFWEYPSDVSEVYISLSDEKVKIGDREFKFPLLMEFESDGDLKDIKFDFNLPEFEKLKVVFSELAPNKEVLWVDKCNNMSGTGANLNGDYCYFLGSKNNAKSFNSIKNSFNLKINNG